MSRYAGIGIASAALLLFVPGLGAVHLFDRDEINFAEIAREMLITGEWSQPSVGFRSFYEKPPLFMWLQAASMSVFGVGEFAARFPNALCGAITLVVLYRLGAQIRGRLFGLLWMLAYLGSLLPHFFCPFWALAERAPSRPVYRPNHDARRGELGNLPSEQASATRGGS